MTSISDRKNKSQVASATEAPEKRRHFHVPTLATLSSDLRTLFINVCILAVFLVLIPVVAAQFMRNQVIIEPISVPTALNVRGLSSDVAANRLWDALYEVQNAATTSKTRISAIPKSQRVDFSIPDSGISIDSLVYYVRQFFHGYETRISGEFRCADAACAPEGMSLRVRVLSDRLEVIQLPPRGQESENDYFREAASQILTILDPFTASAAEAGTNPQRAMAMAERLVLLHHPDAKWAHNLIGNLKSDVGDLDGAISEFRAALDLDPDFLVAKTNLGSTLVAKGDLKGAEDAFSDVAKVLPGDKFLALGRSKLALAQGKPNDAVQYLLDADERDPATSRYFFLAANIEYGAGQTDKAVTYANRALDVNPADIGPLTLLAAVYLGSNAPDKAEAVFRRAADFAPTDPEVQGELGVILLGTHKYAEALARAERALAISPNEIAYQLTRARALNSLARYRDALSQVEVAQKLDPSNPEISMEYGDDYAALGRKDDAIAAYDKVIALIPGTPSASIAALQIKLLTSPSAPTTVGPSGQP